MRLFALIVQLNVSFLFETTIEQIEEVSIDLWRGYKTLVMELIPNVQVVADRFHVALQVNKELDTQRKREIIPATALAKKHKITLKESRV